MSDTIEIHMISNRPNLDFFIQMWNDVKTDRFDRRINCTIKVLMLDYPEKKFVLNNGINVEYIKQRTFPKTSFMNQAWARNELLCYANSDCSYVLFFDDMQRPDSNILVEHLNCLKMPFNVCGRRMECDKDGANCKEDYRNNMGGYARECGYGEFWTTNSSTRLDSIFAVNGFDNRYAGGSGGEDYDMCMRITRLGGGAERVIYNPNAIAYHYNHDHLGRVAGPGGPVCGYSHITSDWKNIPEYKHFGKWENMDGGDKYEFWWDNGIKYYRCKICNGIGILDSLQVYYHNRDKGIVRVENGLEQVRDALMLKKVV